MEFESPETVALINDLAKKHRVKPPHLSKMLYIFGAQAIGRSENRNPGGSIVTAIEEKFRKISIAKELLEKILGSDAFIDDILDFAVTIGEHDPSREGNRRLERYMNAEPGRKLDSARLMLQEVYNNLSEKNNREV